MDNFRENYFVAREIVAQELIQKYNLVESYKDDDRLTLDSTNYSIHLTFNIPEGENITVSEKGREPGYGRSFMDMVFQKYPERNDMIIFLKDLFDNIEQYDYTTKTIKKKLIKKTQFIENQFPEYFKTTNI